MQTSANHRPGTAEATRRMTATRRVAKVARKATNLRVGTSGYAYPEWEAAGFYPAGTPSEKMLPLYAQRFRVTELRPAGEGDLLARLAALRRQFEAEGLLELQKRLRRPVLPKRIGVITAEGGAARDDLLAGLERRGWSGEIVWAFAPVQDRKAAPAITRAMSDLAALADVEAIVVSRGGGSLTDLWAFCDEDLCRTVAMLAVPVYSAVGHERDVTLIDDVAAVRCSTMSRVLSCMVTYGRQTMFCGSPPAQSR